MEPGMMVSCIIKNDNHLSSSLHHLLQQHPKELKGGQSVELFMLSRIDESPVIQAYRPKISNTLSSGMMEKYRILIFRWHPHAKPRSMLLEMNLIHGPHINITSPHNRLQFFYIPPAARDLHGQLQVGAS
jgi:hypothetical protein